MAKPKPPKAFLYIALIALGTWCTATCPAQDLPLNGIPDPQVLMAGPQGNDQESSFVGIEAVDAPALHTQDGRTGIGSQERFGQGIIIDAEGIIATNKHIIGAAKHILVTLSTGQSFEAKLLRDSQTDLSLIKIDTSFPLRAIAIADPSEIQTGDHVIAIPNAALNHQNKLGGEIIKVFKETSSDKVELMEINIPLKPGDSGGAILNENGSLLGLIMGKQISDPSKSFCIASSRIQQEYFSYRDSILN